MRWYLQDGVGVLGFAAAWSHRMNNYVLFMVDVNRLLLSLIEKYKSKRQKKKWVQTIGNANFNSTTIMAVIHLDNLGGQRHAGINRTHEVLLQNIIYIYIYGIDYIKISNEL